MLRPISSGYAGTDKSLLDHSGLRVAIVSDAMPERNGVGAYYHDLVDHLRDHIQNVILICPGHENGGWEGWLRFPLPGDSTQRLSVPPLRMINRRLREFSADVIIVPTPGPYGLLGMRLARRLDARLIVGFHTHYEGLTDLYWNWVSRTVTRGYFEFCNRLLFRYSDMVLANSQSMVNVAQAGGAGKVELMGTPIPRAFITDPVQSPGTELKRVMFAGRLAAEKNVDRVIAAAERLPEIDFFIAGDGPLRESVEAAAARLPNLKYLQWLSRERMLEILDSMDMLVLPSRVESFGTIALEAMARARLVLVSAACGINDWPSLSRAIFQISTTETLESAITRIAALDPAVRCKKGELAAVAARELNDWNVQRWVQTLIQVTTRP